MEKLCEKVQQLVQPAAVGLNLLVSQMVVEKSRPDYFCTVLQLKLEFFIASNIHFSTALLTSTSSKLWSFSCSLIIGVV